MAPSEVDFYKTLAVHRHATDDEIKKAFRKAARDTHPDKNPDDPMAKEKFQELQRAYDTLKDQLERSKYDEDNQYHGLPESSRPKPKSKTATRYTTSSAGTTGPTPTWGPPPSSFSSGRGFPHQTQAHSTPSSRHTGHKTTYEDFTSTYSSARRQRSGGFERSTGFDYGNSYRATPPKPSTNDFEDNYDGYYHPGGYRSESPRNRGESAYTRTSQRQSNATPSGTPKPSTSTRRAHSTVGEQRDPDTQGPDFNLGAYIKEQRAKEDEKRKREEAAEQRERERRAEDRRRKEREEQQRREEQRREEQKRVAEEVRRAEAEEAEASQRRWAQTSSQYSRSEFRPDEPVFHGLRDEDLSRTADERLAAEGRRSKTTTSRSNSRRSPSKPNTMRRDNERTTNDTDGWGAKAGSDNSGSYSRFTSVNHDEDQKYYETFKREQPREPQRYGMFEEVFRKGSDSSNVHGIHSRTKSETQSRERPSSPNRPRTSGPQSATDSGSGESKRQSPDFSFKFPAHGMARVDSYRSEPQVAPPSPQDSPFQKNPDFNFHKARDTNPFTYISHEDNGAHNSNRLHATAPFTRPQSQPIYPTPKQAIPKPRPTPQPHQQQRQQAKQEQQPDFSQFKQELWNDLNKIASFEPPLSTTSPKKKKSTASFKNFGKYRTKSKESVTRNSKAARVESEEDSDDALSPKQKTEQIGTPQSPPMGDGGFEPMDTAPDTGVPEPLNIQATRLNGHIGPRSPMGNFNSRVPTPISPRSTKGDALETMHTMGSVHPLKANGLDSMGSLSSIAPFTRNPAEFGLDGLADLETTLPFPSQASSTPIPSFPGAFPKQKPNLQDIYAPQTPMEVSFSTPIPPEVPKTPKEIDLSTYNMFFADVEEYVVSWNTYEEKIRQLQAVLSKRSLKNIIMDQNAIKHYIKRVKEQDFVLEESYRRAREKHMAALEDWLEYRETVVKNRNNQ